MGYRGARQRRNWTRRIVDDIAYSEPSTELPRVRPVITPKQLQNLPVRSIVAYFGTWAGRRNCQDPAGYAGHCRRGSNGQLYFAVSLRPIFGFDHCRRNRGMAENRASSLIMDRSVWVRF